MQVASVVNFGAFVSIPGTKNQGLIHKSQISNAPVDDAAEVLQRGESVWCKVIKFTASKISVLSIYLLSTHHFCPSHAELIIKIADCVNDRGHIFKNYLIKFIWTYLSLVKPLCGYFY
jgi:predicted RNA-binding protein with RPS1 domain